MYFALRDELHAYLEHLADDFGVRERIRFDTEVLGAAYDEDAQEWDGARRRRARRCAPTW